MEWPKDLPPPPKPGEYGIADDTQARYLSHFVDMVTRELERAGAVSWAWVSDSSEIGDFPIDDAQLAKCAKSLGVRMEMGDRVVDIARRLKDAQDAG